MYRLDSKLTIDSFIIRPIHLLLIFSYISYTYRKYTIYIYQFLHEKYKLTHNPYHTILVGLFI